MGHIDPDASGAPHSPLDGEASPGDGVGAGVPLSLRRKAQYASGQLVELTITSMLNVFVLFYVTAVCGLPGWMAGLALGVGLVVDAVMEPLIGSLSDGWRSRFGRRVPFMVAALAPLIISFNLIFALPTTLDQTTQFFWLTFLSIMLRIAMSMFSLPYQALGTELSEDYAERSSIAAWRWGIGILGTFAVIILGYGVFLDGPGGLSRRGDYLPLTLTLSLLVLAGGAVTILTGVATRDRQHLPTPRPGRLALRLFGEVREVFSSRTFVLLFLASLLFNISGGLAQALSLHLATFFWKLDPALIQPISLAAVIGLAAGAPLTAPLAKRMEKRTMLVMGKVGMFLFSAVPVTLSLMGLLPLRGASLSAFLAGVAFLNGAAMGLTVIAFLSIIADAADEHELVYGTRREGLYVAGWSFAAKAATGGGILIAGLILQLIHFPSHLSEQGAASAELPAATVMWLGVAAGPGSGLLSLAALGFVLFYAIDKRTHARIIAELRARRLAAQ